jgi:non-heme chloroperoxidase
MALESSRVVTSVELPNGVTLPYVQQGDPLGAPLLMVHAFLDSWRSFELVLPHLPESIRAIALTQRGHGEASRVDSGYRFGDFASDLALFTDALELDAAVVAGHSAGGVVAQRFAIDHPRRTRGPVLIGSPLTLRHKPGLQELWNTTLSRLTDPIDPDFVRDFQTSALPGPVPEGFFEILVRESLKVPAHVWRSTFEGFLEDDFSEDLARITAPPLVVWGDQDGILDRNEQDALVRAISGARLVVYPGVGHSPNWEAPQRLATDLAAFIGSLGPEGSAP